MKFLPYQYRSALQRTSSLLVCLFVLLLLAGCTNQQSSAIPTPDLEILAPTATGVTARVEVVIVVVTATAAPAPSPTVAPTPAPPAADATSAPEGEAAAETGTETAEEAPAQPTAAPTEAATASGGGQAQAQEMSNQQLINRGEEIYAEECASCHQLSGEGTDIYPALNGSGVLESGDPTQAIQIVLYGRGEMPAFEDTLSNQQIASVLSYERNAWQNDGSVVRVAQVRQVRQGGSATTEQAADTEIADTDAEDATSTAEATAAPDEATEPDEASEPDETATSEAEPTPEPAAAAADSGQAMQADEDLIAQGEQVYATECASCHQLHGEGNATYPALNRSALLTADDPTAAIDIVLYGQGEMPAFVDLLSTQEIAAVLSHERNAWDNDASIVTVEQVQAVQEGEQGAAADATGEPAAEMTATDNVTPTGTVTGTQTADLTGTATVTETDTSAVETTPTPGAEVADEETPTPQATVTTGGDAGGPNVPLTWTPTIDVTPLLPTAEIAGSAAMTTTPTVTSTTSGNAGGPDVPLTWTPAREVTPLLPMTEISTTATTGTPTPQATAAATGTVTATVATTSTPAATMAGTATAAPTDEEEGGEGGETNDGAAAASEEELISMGESIYAEECASCHQFNGEGNSTYPPLNGSELLTADDPTQAINIVLYGQGEMPAFEGLLSTEEIAAVLSHERNAWDNTASVVTVEQVEEVSRN